MVVQDRKLDALTSVLTARQRAIVFVQTWVTDTTPDERLTRYCPPQDKADFETIIRAVARGNSELHGVCNYLFEWVAEMERSIHWLRTLEMYQVRDAAVPQAVRRSLPRLPAVWDIERKTHRGYGTSATKNEPDPATWEQFTQRMVRDIGEGLQLRWQDYLRAEKAHAEASEALGTSVVHHTAREAFDYLREDILRLNDQMKEAGHLMKLPELDYEPDNYAKGAFKLEVLREVSPGKHAREWMHDQAQKELEEWEREQAELFDDEE